MSINSKVADPNQNSYVTINEVNTYMNYRYSTSNWDNLTVSDKEAVIIQSAKDLDVFNFVDDIYYDAQGLSFPRSSHETVAGNVGTPITLSTFRHSNLYSTTYMKIPDDYWEQGSCHITSGTPVRDIRRITGSDASNGEITVATDFSATPTTNTEFRVFAPIDKNIKDAQCEQILFIVNNPNFETILNYKTIGANKVAIGDVKLDMHSNTPSHVSISSEAKKLLSRWIRKNVRIGRG